MDRIHAYLPGWDVPKMQGDLFTDHFGLVSDFLSECWDRLRGETRLGVILGRVDYGGALSGRDTTAVNRTVSDLLKLLYPSDTLPITDEDLKEYAQRLQATVLPTWPKEVIVEWLHRYAGGGEKTASRSSERR